MGILAEVFGLGKVVLAVILNWPCQNLLVQFVCISLVIGSLLCSQ